MSAKNVIKVLYAPTKAFKDITQNLKFVGPILVLILFVATGTASQYVQNSKIYYQKTTPTSTDINNPDLWTDNYKTWISNANVTSNSNDCLFGGSSIQFKTRNDSYILVKLNATFSVNCTGDYNYKNLTFSLKWIQPSAQAPNNATLYLFSGSEEDYFYRSLTNDVARNNTWGNLTIPLGPSETRWVNSSNRATWSNITNFQMIFTWHESVNSNLTVLVDKMFFRSDSYETTLNASGSDATYIVLNIVVSLVEGYIFYWLIFSAALFVAARIFKVKADLKTVLIIIGYSMIALSVMQIAFTVLYASIPPIYATLDKATPESIYILVASFVPFASILFPIWSIVITAFGTRAAFNFTTRRAIIAAAIAFLPYYLLIVLLG